jgi:hypothetical protein
MSLSGSRHPPPDYTQSSVKLRLFVYVAAVMLLLGLIDRAGDPDVWRWLRNRNAVLSHEEPFDNRLTGHGLRTAADPVGTFVAVPDSKSDAQATATAPQLDPVERAWQQGWKDIMSCLAADEQSLLFEMLHAALAHRPLAAEQSDKAAESLQNTQKLWEDYQAAAFQSVANLKGDDQVLWVDVLRQVNGRFAEARSALQAVVDGRTVTESEEEVLRTLQATLSALARQAIQDDTIIFRPAERAIWFYELARVHDADPRQLRKSSLGRVAYLQLHKQPADYRGKVVTVSGTVRLAQRVPAPPNYLGVKEYCVYWIHPSGGPDSPIIVYALNTPPGFPSIGNRDADPSAGKLREDVGVTGVFFKRWAYAARGGTFTAPLLIANVPDWQPQPAVAAKPPMNALELAAAALAALLIAVCIAAVLWKRSSRSHRKTAATSGGFTDLGNLALGPSPRERLAELERHAHKEGKN